MILRRSTQCEPVPEHARPGQRTITVTEAELARLLIGTARCQAAIVAAVDDSGLATRGLFRQAVRDRLLDQLPQFEDQAGWEDVPGRALLAQLLPGDDPEMAVRGALARLLEARDTSPVR